MMQLKDYQQMALLRFDQWQESLAQSRQETVEHIAVFTDKKLTPPAELGNFPADGMGKDAAGGQAAREGGRVRARAQTMQAVPIPHACLKVPTGGGKTLLAAACLEKLHMQNGLVLWIVPTKAIFEQTDKALKNREHPYRQMLERASGGRVKLIKKDDAFSRLDVANYLCVMLVMFPATNRNKNKEFLRMFRDSGSYESLFPDSDMALSEGRLLEEYPDLERDGDGPVKRSLFNALKILRPVVILDEAHKAYGTRAGKDFADSVNRLDPSLVIELSATPNAGISNLLVDITGVELKDEEMIKLPVQVTSETGEVEWQKTLSDAHEEMQRLSQEADLLHGSEGRYIRPIAVVRVERTGDDQRDGERVHALDVFDYLTRSLSVPDSHVAIQSSTRHDLDKEDLLSPQSGIRWIITKAALMEGWDCPFAYLLVMLDNTNSQRALTQLVGRVMRQPDAQRTGREALDQCYVYCWKVDVHNAVGQVKLSLEEQGLTGLGNDVLRSDVPYERKKIERRPQYRGEEFFLPTVQHRTADGEWAELGLSASHPALLGLVRDKGVRSAGHAIRAAHSADGHC